MKKLILSALLAASFAVNAQEETTLVSGETLIGFLMASSVCEGLMVKRGHPAAAEVWLKEAVNLEGVLSEGYPAAMLTKIRKDGYDMGFNENLPEDVGVTIEDLAGDCKAAADQLKKAE